MRKRKQHRIPDRHALKGHLRRLAFASFLAALSIVCGKYLAFPVGVAMRFSLENLPILLAGMVLGPAMGIMTGVVADLVGCLMVGYQINPLVTLGAAVIGLLGGLLYRCLSRFPMMPRVVISTLSAHLIGSVLIKTWGLAAFYDMPFYALLLWRLLNYVIVGAVECVIVYYILTNKTVRHSLEKLR
jgi:ECF transporter S component (folate family)